jgi:hypothetical protein
MAKIKLGDRPKNIKRLVKVALPEGGTATLNMDFIYRTRREMGEFLDEILKEARVKTNAMADDLDLSLAEALATAVEKNAEYIMACATGWDLEDEWTRANVERFCDEYPGVAIAVMTAYRETMSEGKAGN